MNVRYNAARFVAASRDPSLPPDDLICMVMIELPDGGVTALAIPENEMVEKVGVDPVKEELYIQRRVKEAVSSMLAGAVSDLTLERTTDRLRPRP